MRFAIISVVNYSANIITQHTSSARAHGIELSDLNDTAQGLHEGGSTGAEAQDSSDSAILQQEGKRDSIGCIPMFQGPPKRFIRTIRPVAGSSFNVSIPHLQRLSVSPTI